MTPRPYGLPLPGSASAPPPAYLRCGRAVPVPAPAPLVRESPPLPPLLPRCTRTAPAVPR